MSVTVKVKVCSDCVEFNSRRHDEPQLVSEKMSDVALAFGLWEDYEFDLAECSVADFLEATACGICGGSLTGDRRRHNDQSFGDDRRLATSLDRRSPFNRGSRVFVASLSAA